MMKITIFPKDSRSFYGAIDEELTNINADRLKEIREWCHFAGVHGGWSCSHDLRVCFSDEKDMTLFLLRWS